MTTGMRRIGILPDLVARPLFSRFREPEFDVVRDAPGALGIKLREQQLDGAFLSPFDVARSPRGLKPAGGGSLVARAGSNTARLLFREGVRSVRTLSVDPGRISEVVLAHIVLIEQYDIVPQIMPRRGGPEDALGECDAVLLAGDEASGARAIDEGLDLVEEWMDIADLPFVHGLWYVRDGIVGASEGEDTGLTDLFECAAGGSGAGAVSYRFDEEARAGVAEFVRMAYYHGILKEIPEFTAFLPESAA
jgi:predicted solute-binding protein